MASAAEQLAANLNFGALAKAEELKKRIWFTLGALLVYRLGTYIPLPGIDPNAWNQIFNSQAGGILGMFNMFAGGGIHRMAIFALNIMPYISASIIVQLMTTVSPTLEALKKEGESGRKTINQYTRYLTVVLAAFQAYGISIGLQGASNVVTDPGPFFVISTVITLTGQTQVQYLELANTCPAQTATASPSASATTTATSSPTGSPSPSWPSCSSSTEQERWHSIARSDSPDREPEQVTKRSEGSRYSGSLTLWWGVLLLRILEAEAVGTASSTVMCYIQ